MNPSTQSSRVAGGWNLSRHAMRDRQVTPAEGHRAKVLTDNTLTSTCNSELPFHQNMSNIDRRMKEYAASTCADWVQTQALPAMMQSLMLSKFT